MPHPEARLKRGGSSLRSKLASGATVVSVSLALALAMFSLPTVIAVDIQFARLDPPKPAFPITVNPQNRTITEDPGVEAILDEHQSGLQAAVGTAGEYITHLAVWISQLPMYHTLAGAAGSGLVTIKPGFRQEQVADAFARELDWNPTQKATFLKQLKVAEPTMSEGEFVPGVYTVRGFMAPGDVQIMLNEEFKHEIQARYSSSTEELLPLDDALTIASMLEKETSDPDEMRIISGIIWNRLWKGMNLQIDATLQYAKATNANTVTTWWGPVKPADKYIKSPYNTYQNKGLPPGPIASPSTAAVLAALNPKKTDCIFYFHDRRGGFHCSPTYKQHVALLKKYYGQGK